MGKFYLKKALMGYKESEQSKADYMAWDIDEADDFFSKMSKLTKENQDNKELLSQSREENEKLAEENKKLQAKIKELEENLRKETARTINSQELYLQTKDLLKVEEKKNANLLRISKERANADRKITPKKDRCGYVQIYCEQTKLIKPIKKQVAQGNRSYTVLDKISLLVWKYHFQTPYLASFSSDMVKDLILKDLKTHVLLYDENFGFYDRKSEFEASAKDYDFFNFSINLKSNSKYWEIKFLSWKQIFLY